ncbi:MAG: hypothetical protein CL772_04295 [Chloroflexi bacterium]|nr:hypothetical protein [Chloroflexota bacterium]|tara:strand:- start:5474 stop:5872 length:399 start_codon:yes stop_codon:yes gene_type:complete
MDISIIGTSQITDYVINKIINHTEKISVYSDKHDYNFENKNKSKEKIEILTKNNLEDEIPNIAKSSEIIFLLTESDSFNSFSHKKIIHNEPNKKIVLLINDIEIYEIYKEMNISVINPTELDNQDFAYLVKG